MELVTSPSNDQLQNYQALVEDQTEPSQYEKTLFDFLNNEYPAAKPLLAIDQTGALLGGLTYVECDDSDVVFVGCDCTAQNDGDEVEDELWTRLAHTIAESSTIAVRCPVGLVDHYSRFGLTTQGRTLRQVTISKAALTTVLRRSTASGLRQPPAGTTLVGLGRSKLDSLIWLDQHVTGRSRSSFLRTYLTKCVSVETKLATNKKGDVLGYGCLTELTQADSYKIAPLFAADSETALALLAILISSLPDDATICLGILQGTIGDYCLSSLLSAVVPALDVTLATLYSRAYHDRLDATRLFVPHDHLCSFDA